MNILRFFRRTTTGNIPSQPPTDAQLGVQAKAVNFLIAHGHITALDVQRMGTTAPHRLLNRLRRMGVLYGTRHARGFVWVPNASGSGRHKLHYWTGKVPSYLTERKRGERS